MTSKRKFDIITFLDKYEKEKAIGLFSVHKDNSIFVFDVENIVDNEIIIRLNDKTSHSITLNDNNDAQLLFFLIKEIKNGHRSFVKTEYLISDENKLKLITEINK
ncbi:MAG: hypothetical protein AB7F53_05300 [Nitrososphaeraceae archaeon]